MPKEVYEKYRNGLKRMKERKLKFDYKNVDTLCYLEKEGFSIIKMAELLRKNEKGLNR